MASRYDSRTTTFSPEGRLFQVEYAIEAINHSGACLGILATDGVIIAAEKKDTNKLLAKPKMSEKLYVIDHHIVCAVAGLTADANVLINYLRRSAQNYRLQFQEPQPMESLIRAVCDLKQGYTQFGGQRPFGVSFLYAGWDKHHGFQLYQSDPSGNYGGWNACAIGSNSTAATSILKKEYNANISIQDAIRLAVKCLHKSMDSAAPSAEKLEFSVLTRREGTDKLDQRILGEEELQKYLDALVAEELAKAEAEKKKT